MKKNLLIFNRGARMSYEIGDIIYLINSEYLKEYESENLHVVEKNESIYVRKFTVKNKFRDRMTLWCHNDAKLYTWNYKSKLLFKQRCNIFAFEYDSIDDNEVGEYLFQQSKVQSIMRYIQFEIINNLAYKKLITDDDFTLMKTFALWNSKLLTEQDKLLNLESDKIKKYFADNK